MKIRKELLADHARISPASQSTLTNTLKEVGCNEFLGPRQTADGSLSFPVRTSSGTTHDLGELSAGEKEMILYGFLRIRNSAPKIRILLDEPEPSLKPKLIRRVKILDLRAFDHPSIANEGDLATTKTRRYLVLGRFPG
jgi:predicted ATPase